MEAEIVPPAVEPSATSGTRALDDPPGGVLFWLVVALELLAFAMVFAVIANLRSTEVADFRAGQAALSSVHGLVLTFTLVTSGWLAAEAVASVRARRLVAARRYYAAAFATGLAFVVLKVADYVGKTREGFTLDRSDFWNAYFLGTGFHFVHVVVGLGLLAYVGLTIGRTSYEDEETTVAGTALFWHMCDIAWFFLFPLLYVGA